MTRLSQGMQQDGYKRYTRALIMIYNAFPPAKGNNKKRDRAISFARKKILDHAKREDITEFYVKVRQHSYNVTIHDKDLLSISLIE